MTCYFQVYELWIFATVIWNFWFNSNHTITVCGDWSFVSENVCYYSATPFSERIPDWLSGQSCMLSCLCNESPGKLPQPYSSSCRIHEQWERCNTWSCTVWAPTTAAFLQGMPLPLWDGQALLAEEESTTLVYPTLRYNPFLSAFKSPKAYVSLLPSLKLIPLQLLSDFTSSVFWHLHEVMSPRQEC